MSDNEAVLKMLAGANFGPDASLTLPSGEVLDSAEAQVMTAMYVPDSEPETIVYAVGLCYASVCTNESTKKASSFLNLSHPTGLDRPWTVADENFAGGAPNPTPCDRNPETHRHVLFNC